MNTLTSPGNVDHTALHEHALQALASADLALAHAEQLPIAEPHQGKDVTQAWLQDTLAAQAPGAVLRGVRQLDAHDGMTSRMRLALDWNDAGQAAGLPAHLFVKATPASGFLRETLAVLHMHELEVKFYEQIQPELPSLAPRAQYARAYPGGRFLLVLDDLTASGSRPFWQSDDCGVDHVRAVSRALAQLHARYWQSPRLHGDLVWVRPRTRRFGWRWLRQSFCTTRDAFLKKGESELLSPENARLLRRWNECADAVFAYWEELPHTVLHGDCHLGNTFAYPDGRAGLFDWQVIFAGHGLRDLAYFMLSALSDEQRAQHERSIVDLYLDVLAEHGVRLDRESAWNDYCLFALDRWDAGITSYVHGVYGHAESGQVRSLQSIAGCLRDNDVAGRLESLLRRRKAG